MHTYLRYVLIYLTQGDNVKDTKGRAMLQGLPAEPDSTLHDSVALLGAVPALSGLMTPEVIAICQLTN